MTNLIDLLDTLKDSDKLIKAKSLIENGADVNNSDESNTTVLHVAALHGHLEICKMLIERGAKVNVKNKGGYTPLDFANKHNYTEVANLLKENDERA